MCEAERRNACVFLYIDCLKKEKHVYKRAQKKKSITYMLKKIFENDKTLFSRGEDNCENDHQDDDDDGNDSNNDD